MIGLNEILLGMLLVNWVSLMILGKLLCTIFLLLTFVLIGRALLLI